MVKRLLALLIVGLLVFVACGGDDEATESAQRGPCAEEAPEGEDVEGLPENFPVTDAVVFIGSDEAGPSTIIEGVYLADLEEAFPDYEDAFEESDYDITKDEQEANDAEIFFAGEGTTGQVNMYADCDGQTKIRITIRPD
jgi:hypothetical protein